MWKIFIDEKVIYLIFDDGLVFVVIFWVLEQFKKYDVKVMFFCVGDNVCKYLDVFKQVFSEGYVVGNYIFNYFNGWIIENIFYFYNVCYCVNWMNFVFFCFLYGWLKFKQVQFLQWYYCIVMWDVFSGDFDLKIFIE